MKKMLVISIMLLAILLGGCASGSAGDTAAQPATGNSPDTASQTVTEASENVSENDPEKTSEITSEIVSEVETTEDTGNTAETLTEVASGSSSQEVGSTEKTAGVYTQISQEEAKRMMALDDGHVVVDVRRLDEYLEGHIPGAILVTNENIEDTPPSKLPDKNQIILIYCRSGRRSKEASQKLADMGYTRIYEFGGIIDWTGDVVEGKEQ